MKSLPRTRICALVAFGTVALAGCWDDGSVTISGDVEGLDSLATRGDSLIAEAARRASLADSLQALTSMMQSGVPGAANDSIVAAMAGTLIPVTETIPESRAALLTRRAQARGDSMARAAALRYSTSSSGSRSMADSIRGVIKLIGTPPALQPVLEVAESSTPVMLSGMATSGMQKLAGAEIVVRGVRVSPRDIVVSEYYIRAMNGVPAFDGVLEAGDDGYSLEMTDGSGRKRLSAIPASLRGLSGARVWVTVPQGTSTPLAFGQIRR